MEARRWGSQGGMKREDVSRGRGAGGASSMLFMLMIEPSSSSNSPLSGLIKPVAMRAAGTKPHFGFRLSNIRAVPREEDPTQQSAQVLDSIGLAGLKYDDHKPTRTAKNSAPHPLPPTRPQFTKGKKVVSYIDINDDELSKLATKQPSPLRERLPAQIALPIGDPPLPLLLKAPESPSPCPSPDPESHRTHRTAFEESSDLGPDPEDTSVLRYMAVPSPLSDPDTDMDDGGLDAFQLKTPMADGRVALQPLKGEKLTQRRWKLPSPSSTRGFQTPIESKPSIPGSGGSKTSFKKRRLSAKPKTAHEETLHLPKVKPLTDNDFTVINGRKYSNAKLSQWRADGWLGPKEESSLMAKPRWKVASSGFSPEPSPTDRRPTSPAPERQKGAVNPRPMTVSGSGC